MFKSILHVLICLLYILSIESCCKSSKCQCYKEWGQKVDDCTPKHFGPYPLGGAYDYLYFKPGSWWVYRNNLSGETDSIYVTSCDTAVYTRIGETLEWQSVTYTSIRIKTRSDVYNAEYEYSRLANYPDQMDFKYTQVQWRSSSRASSQSGPYDVFYYPFPEKNYPGYFEYYPVLNINGVDYFEVGVYQSDQIDQTIQLPQKLPNQVGHGGTSKYFWAKGYGLIRSECLIYDYITKQNYLQQWDIVKNHLIH